MDKLKELIEISPAILSDPDGSHRLIAKVRYRLKAGSRAIHGFETFTGAGRSLSSACEALMNSIVTASHHSGRGRPTSRCVVARHL
jgi:hypothetical protein